MVLTYFSDLFGCVVKIEQFPFRRQAILSLTAISREGAGNPGFFMTYNWHEAYKAALLESDWTKMQGRVQAAEAEIDQRLRVLSEDHGGTPEERHAIADAMNSLGLLRKDVASWQDRQNQPSTL